MSISEYDVARIAKLAHIALDGAQARTVREELNGMLALIEQLQAVDTTGVEPLAHPLSVMGEIPLRLREDVADGVVTEPATDSTTVPATPDRERLMGNAPARHNGLFLVPAVIE